MCAEPRVTDDDDSRFVFEGVGPAISPPTLEQQQIRVFLRRVLADADTYPDDYGALREPLTVLAENYARTCHTADEIARRLEAACAREDEQGAAAVLLRRVWQAQLRAGIA